MLSTEDSILAQGKYYTDAIYWRQHFGTGVNNTQMLSTEDSILAQGKYYTDAIYWRQHFGTG